jgi:hypothetical protein
LKEEGRKRNDKGEIDCKKIKINTNGGKYISRNIW